MKYMISAMKTCIHLEKIYFDLRDSKITKTSIKLLASGIRALPNIRSFTLLMDNLDKDPFNKILEEVDYLEKKYETNDCLILTRKV